MPTAPRLFNDTANLQPSNGRLNASATADAYGAGIGRALSRVGDAGFQLVAELEARANEADAREGDTEYQRREREILFGRVGDPTSADETEREDRPGYMSMRGRNAVERRVAVEDELRKVAEEVGDRRRSRGSRAAYDDVIARRLENTLESMDRHVLTETRTYEDEAREAQAIEARNGAVASYADEALAAAHINTGIDVVLDQSEAFGDSPERMEQRVQEYQSGAWAQVIIRRADDDPSAAQAMFEARRGTMTAEDIGRVTGALREVVLADRARHMVEDLMVQAGGDGRAFMALAEDIGDTRLRDEVIQRGGALLQQRETFEARDTDNAEERARTAIARGGVGAVTGGDRAILVREGRWDSLVDSTGSGSTTAARRDMENFKNQLLSVAMDDPHSFHIIVDAMRGVRAQGVTDEMIQQAAGMSAQQLLDMRVRMSSIAAEDWNTVRERQRYMRGEIGSGASMDTNVERTYRNVITIGEAAAAQQGIDVAARGGMLGVGRDQLERQGQFRSFILAEVQAHYRNSGGAEPTVAQMDAMVARALLQGRGDRRAFEARQAPQGAFLGMGGVRVQIPFNRIPDADRRALAAEWRRQNPRVTVRQGSREERDFEKWVEDSYARSLMAR